MELIWNWFGIAERKKLKLKFTTSKYIPFKVKSWKSSNRPQEVDREALKNSPSFSGEIVGLSGGESNPIAQDNKSFAYDNSVLQLKADGLGAKQFDDVGLRRSGVGDW